MKNRSLLVRKMELFYNDIKDKRRGRMRLQTDKEFDQNKMKKLNKKFHVEMHQTNLRGGKAFAAEQKIREFKNFLQRIKQIEKKRKRLKPNNLIKKAAENMNNIISMKYGVAPEKTEQKSLDQNVGESFKGLYDFVRLKKIKETKDHPQKFDGKSDTRKKKLRNLLDI